MESIYWMDEQWSYIQSSQLNSKLLFGHLQCKAVGERAEGDMGAQASPGRQQLHHELKNRKLQVSL